MFSNLQVYFPEKIGEVGGEKRKSDKEESKDVIKFVFGHNLRNLLENNRTEYELLQDDKKMQKNSKQETGAARRILTTPKSGSRR